MPRVVHIATRSSELALWQAGYVAERLRALEGDLDAELVEVSTAGDRDRQRALDRFRGTGVFTREVQEAVLDGRADLTVHSLKDLPTEPVEGLVLAAVPQRASMFDALVVSKGRELPAGLDSLPLGARVGTGSLRRQAQLLHVRPDLIVEPARGNVPTRVEKLDAGEFDAIVLAEAGLNRLGMTDRIALGLRPPVMYAAVGQGALGLECRADDPATRELLARLDDPATRAAVTAERALLAALRAGCHAPVGVWTRHEAGRLVLEAVVLSSDGRERLHVRTERPPAEAADLGGHAADELLARGAGRLVEMP
ncbi:MAG: hydroxymethylbilane synthase [Planctomycetes bacterium]|nr:hydroxymethylbilane synthase [Planctomycetota bacterium]